MPHVVTLVADPARAPLDVATIERVAQAVRGAEPDVLAPGEAVDIHCPEPVDGDRLETALAGAPFDAFVLPASGRRKQILVSDMDSTIVTSETLDELAAYAGLKAEVAAITRRSMEGELDFATALLARVEMLRGLALSALAETWRQTSLMAGAAELVATMRAHGAYTVLVSGGFTYFTARVAEVLGFDEHRANVLLDDGAALTGQVALPILDRTAKLATLREAAAARGLPFDATLAVGDGANDLEMIRAAGLGVAFHAKPLVSREAKARVKHGNLRALLFAQGYRLGDVVQPG